MVIGDDFVWAQIGKAGGDHTVAAFRLLKDPRIACDWRFSDGSTNRTKSERIGNTLISRIAMRDCD